MNYPSVRYALINLSVPAVKIKTFTAGYGDFVIHLRMLKEYWLRDPDMIALSTGALTGTGAPGSGGMNWCYWKRNVLQVIPAEGRFGAVCRYGQIDHLLIGGTALNPLDIIVRDGEFTFMSSTARHANAAYIHRNIKRQTNSDAVILSVGAREILEDGAFSLGDASLAHKLSKKNLRSITVTATGGIPIHDPESFLSICQTICQAQRDKQRTSMTTKVISRYLSLDNSAYRHKTFPALAMDSYPEPIRLTAELLLGLCWGDLFPMDEPLAHAALLLNAYTGKLFTVHSIEKAAQEFIIAAKLSRYW